MNKCLIFTLIVMIGITGIMAEGPECSSWLGYCQVTDQCCRDLVCMGYLAKCVPGKIVDDNRPKGKGPFPPGN
ncbi:uncharacterized protein LOC112553110 [Pogonomyrmex barbatus]|uniref:Uncharacterized protein LOC112553110 n=1 Tax=Pogonomyrmex barbatus TaxID=144034 RepID=A0A8N1SCF6_9HYME|nr:uncharacterized protein LOC112553110 [Pogonomyrmex barbatus]XP_025075925.1 uncharacterized protein LOC112553110 [Pogonomyrmex barbatus]XP_025075926.1 uncharacterized protein LOC112553110 [Pogonomyrmex barbatus]XP_025075927.1 uncharacterized protein LOC112553110 [Pogonomyrmex barbatus]